MPRDLEYYKNSVRRQIRDIVADMTHPDFQTVIEHVRKIAGVDHVGIGSDFDGITDTVVGLEDVSKYPFLFAELARRGWSDADLMKLSSGNVLRVLGEAEKMSARLKKTRKPSTATIEQMDRGVRVNVVAAGVIDTPMTAPMAALPEILDTEMRHVPAGRMGEPGEVAAAVLWLSSAAAGYVTGTVLAVDGGYLTL